MARTPRTTTQEGSGPRQGDVVIWNLALARTRLVGYVLFKQGGTDPPRHFEGVNIWGKVFREAKRYAQHQAVWLREGLSAPWRLVEAKQEKRQD
jgi:hypothetical protein